MDSLHLESKFYKTISQIKKRYPFALPTEDFKISKKWNTSYSKSILNARRTLAEITTEDLKGKSCENPLCKIVKEEYFKCSKVTGSCINTSIAEVLLPMVPFISNLEDNNLSYEETNLAIKTTISRIKNGIKTRTHKTLAQDKFIRSQIKTLKERVLQEVNKKIKQTKKMYGTEAYIPKEEKTDIEKMLDEFESEAMKSFYNQNHVSRKRKQQENGNKDIAENHSRYILNILHRFLSFVNDDKSNSKPQIICKDAVKISTIATIQTIPKRFAIHEHDSPQYHELRSQTKNILSDRTTGALSYDLNLQCKSFPEQVSYLYNIDIETYIENDQPNELTVNWKSKKDPPTWRFIIGCVNRDNHRNLTRAVHDIIYQIMKRVESAYKQWALDKFEESGVCYYNKLSSVDEFVKTINENANATNKELTTIDMEKCYPNHNIKSSTNISEFEQPQFLFRETNGEPRYVDKFSTLHLIKNFLDIAYIQESNKFYGEEMCITNTSWKKTDWTFVPITNATKMKSILIQKDTLLTIIQRTIENQHSSIGNGCLEVVNGLIEGQSTSNMYQSILHQMILNMHYDDLIKNGQLQEAIEMSNNTCFFVDDLINWTGHMANHKSVYRKLFNTTIKSSNLSIQFLGLVVYYCTQCNKKSTKMDRSKHNGSLFSSSFLDTYKSNSPKNGLIGICSGTVTRIYRQNSAARNIKLAIAELLIKATKKQYPMPRVITKMKNKLYALSMIERKTNDQTKYLHNILEIFEVKNKKAIVSYSSYCHGRKFSTLCAQCSLEEL